jgi:succinate dehydrogenase/fumarate reductase flavoprotein subunit
VKTDLHARVLSTNDVPIPGIWTAGEMTGLFYNEYPPATSCLPSMTFGRLASAEVAKNLGKPQGEVHGHITQQEVESKRSGSVMLMEKDLLIGEGKSVQA